MIPPLDFEPFLERGRAAVLALLNAMERWAKEAAA